jgi:hypothetical protein
MQHMKHFQFFLPAILISLSTASSAQTAEPWMPEQHVEVLRSMKLTYKKPAGFMEVPGWDCFKEIPKLELIITCAGNQLHAADSQFIAFIPVYRIMTTKDSIDITQMFPNSPFEGVNKMHASQIRGVIRYAVGEEATGNWAKYVTYYSAADAKRKFNADSAVTFSIKLNPNEYYKGKYNHLDALFIQKAGRGYINFFCFYTDKAKKNLPTYWKAIEGVFRYED